MNVCSSHNASHDLRRAKDIMLESVVIRSHRTTPQWKRTVWLINLSAMSRAVLRVYIETQWKITWLILSWTAGVTGTALTRSMRSLRFFSICCGGKRLIRSSAQSNCCSFWNNNTDITFKGQGSELERHAWIQQGHITVTVKTFMFQKTLFNQRNCFQHW